MTSDRDRLIELLKETETNPEKTCPHYLEADCFDCPYDKGEDCDHEARKADFLLANGVILLPLPIGSTVYEIRAKGERSYKHWRGLSMANKEVCPYCHKDNEGYVKMFGRFYLRKDHFNGWNLYAGKGKPLPIKYCPICGRPLKIEQTQVNSIQDDFCGVPCDFMENKLNLLQAEYEMTRDELFNAQKELAKIKTEAYKEVEERLKAETDIDNKWCGKVVLEKHIDNLLKELEGNNQ